MRVYAIYGHSKKVGALLILGALGCLGGVIVNYALTVKEGKCNDFRQGRLAHSSYRNRTGQNTRAFRMLPAWLYEDKTAYLLCVIHYIVMFRTECVARRSS